MIEIVWYFTIGCLFVQLMWIIGLRELYINFNKEERNNIFFTCIIYTLFWPIVLLTMVYIVIKYKKNGF